MELSINVEIEDETATLIAEFWEDDGFIVTDIMSGRIKIIWKNLDVSPLMSKEQWNLIARQLDEKQPQLIEMFMDA